jgi:hypothetical protein
MTLSEDEKNTLAAFARFGGNSPRRAKRYVNLCLLLKTSLQPSSVQIGKDRRVNERAIVALLAIVTALGPSDALFETLVALKPSAGSLESLLKLLNKGTRATENASAKRKTTAEPSTKSRKQATPAVGSTKAREVVTKLLELNRRDSVDQGEEIVAALRRYAPTVRRYAPTVRRDAF